MHAADARDHRRAYYYLVLMSDQRHAVMCYEWQLTRSVLYADKRPLRQNRTLEYFSVLLLLLLDSWHLVACVLGRKERCRQKRHSLTLLLG